jgi:hypothetical protein
VWVMQLLCTMVLVDCNRLDTLHMCVGFVLHIGILILSMLPGCRACRLPACHPRCCCSCCLLDQVAQEGLRPAWPAPLASDPGLAPLRQLVEDCWAAEPGNR